jgi:DNA invertase Pin-like site-specific DNA recombinase
MKSRVDRNNVASAGSSGPRTAVGYVRVSTDMQAADGLSLDAQRAAIRAFCESTGLRLLQIHEDVESGGRADRRGLSKALATPSDVVVVLKFDRISRSIKHFCDLYEEHFSDGSKELVAIRESIRLDSALGRALVSILLVFAQMEREATGERTREAIVHIRKSGFHFGKAPYGFKAVPSMENPRYRVLQEDPQEQRILSRIKALMEQHVSYRKIAQQLNEDGIAAPQGSQ